MAWHPRSSTTDVGGVRAHYVRAGDPRRDKLVLLHGLLVSSWAWRFNLDALAGDWDVIAPCQRGFGWSGRPRGVVSVGLLGRFVLDLLDQLDVERFALVGNSLGGAVALWIARHAPQRVTRVVLVNPLAIAGSMPPVPRLVSSVALAPLYRVAVQPRVARFGLQLLAYHHLEVGADYMAGFRAPFEQRRSVRSAMATIRCLGDAGREIEAALPHIDQPTLVVWGLRDRILRRRAGPRIIAAMPDARLVTFDDAGHCTHEEHPERFNRLVRAFLSQHPKGDG